MSVIHCDNTITLPQAQRLRTFCGFEMANNGHKRSQRCAATYSELLCRIDNNALALVNSGLTRGAPIAVPGTIHRVCRFFPRDSPSWWSVHAAVAVDFRGMVQSVNVGGIGARCNFKRGGETNYDFKRQL